MACFEVGLLKFMLQNFGQEIWPNRRDGIRPLHTPYKERELPIDCTSATHQEVREYSGQRNKLELKLKPMACIEVELLKFMLQNFGQEIWSNRRDGIGPLHTPYKERELPILP